MKVNAEEVEMVQMNDDNASNAPLLHETAEDAAPLEEKDLIRPGSFIWALTFSAGISGLLFGYE